LVLNVQTLVARLHGADAGDQASAAAALARLALDGKSLCAPPTASLTSSRASRAIPLLVALLRSADTAAANAAHVPRQPISDAESEPALIALLRTGTEERKTDAACAIVELAQAGLSLATVTLIMGEGALPLLVNLLRADSEDGKMLAASAITLLARDALTRTLMVAAGALPPLVALLCSGSAARKANAAGAIAVLAQGAPSDSTIATRMVLARTIRATQFLRAVQ
jgi:hypothetical protein